MKITKWIFGLLIIVLSQKPIIADTPFQGIRAGLQLGYGTIDSKVTVQKLTPLPSASDTSDVSGRGGIAGITVDWMNLVGSTKVLMGGELSVNFSTLKGKRSIAGTFPVTNPANNPGDFSINVVFKRAIEASLKIGYLFQETAAPYIKFGPSQEHWKASTVSQSANANGSSSSTGIGLVVGVGAEFPISQRFSWGAEYVYRIPKDCPLVLTQPANLNFQRPINIKPSSSALMFHLNYKLSAIDFSSGGAQKERKRKKPKKPNPCEEPRIVCKKPPKNCRKP